MGKALEEMIHDSGGMTWREVRATPEWLDRSGVLIFEQEHFSDWLHDLGERIREENLPPVIVRLKSRR